MLQKQFFKAQLLMLALLLLASCVKTKSKLIYGIAATYDSTNTTANVVKVSVTKTSGDDDLVALSVDGLPDYMTAEISPINQRTPYDATITFKLSLPAERDMTNWKDYTVTVKAHSNQDVERSQKVTFHYYPLAPAEAFDNKAFFSHEQCTPSGAKTWSVPVLVQNSRQIMLVNFFSDLSSTYSLLADIDGRTKAITIPTSKQGNYTFRGTGTFRAIGQDSLECTINFSRSTVSTFDTCTTILTMGH